METNRKYPAVILSRKAIYENASMMVKWCEENGIFVAAVIKGFNAMRDGCEEEVRAGAKMLAS